MMVNHFRLLRTRILFYTLFSSIFDYFITENVRDMCKKLEEELGSVSDLEEEKEKLEDVVMLQNFINSFHFYLDIDMLLKLENIKLNIFIL